MHISMIFTTAKVFEMPLAKIPMEQASDINMTVSVSTSDKYIYLSIKLFQDNFRSKSN